MVLEKSQPKQLEIPLSMLSRVKLSELTFNLLMDKVFGPHLLELQEITDFKLLIHSHQHGPPNSDTQMFLQDQDQDQDLASQEEDHHQAEVLSQALATLDSLLRMLKETTST